VNPSGRHGLAGWSQHGGGALTWRVEAAEFPPDGATGTNFVSGCQWCVQSQAVPLSAILRGPARIEASCRFTGRTDCPSVFRMEALVLGHPQQQQQQQQPRRETLPVLQRVSTPVLDTSPDCWETARVEFAELVDPARCHSVALVVAGKDGRFWAGDYGAKVAACSVRVLGDPDELERVLRPDAGRWMEERERGLELGGERGSAEEGSVSCSIA
jgi:hypothetical protein